jgi:FolB domain-containing protein
MRWGRFLMSKVSPHYRILITDLTTRCVLGISAEERREQQEIVINVALVADLSVAAASDRFEDTLDYRALKKGVLSLVEQSEYYLLEALTERIADLCLEDPRVHRVTVKVEKPSALRFARSVAVEVEKGR